MNPSGSSDALNVMRCKTLPRLCVSKVGFSVGKLLSVKAKIERF